jgi:hypothetical protein
MEELFNLLKDQDWFYDIGIDPHGRYVVFVKTMNQTILSSIPYHFDGKQVLCHYSSFKDADKYNFIYPSNTPKISFPKEVLPPKIDEEELDLDALVKELDRLEELCGFNILNDIFYEVHDHKNAVTNLSEKFPQVRKSMDKLYLQYGFDVLYDLLEC